MKRTKLLLLAALCLLACSCVKERQVPVIGKAPVDVLSEHEVKAEVLVAWAKGGPDGATVVSVNAESGLSAVDAATLTSIRTLRAGRDWDKLRAVVTEPGGAVNAGNFLTAAMELGLVKKIYWVLPYRLFSNIPGAEREIKHFLRSRPAGLTAAEIDRMKMDMGCLNGHVRGKELYICGFSTLHRITDPVILDIGVDFFPAMAFEYGVNKLGAVKTLLDAFELRDLKVMQADLTYGIQEGRTRPLHRFLGEEMAEVLRNPSILKKDAPPELWTARDMAENMFSGGEGKKVLTYLGEPLKKFPGDPALEMIKAAALLRAGKGQAAADIAEKLCSSRKDYCEAFTYLAYLADVRGDKELHRFLNEKAQLSGGASPRHTLHYTAFAGSTAAIGVAPRESY